MAGIVNGSSKGDDPEFSIDVSRDFSRTPGGRYRSDGDYSGEDFRESVLIPALEQHARIVVDLDGVLGYTTSFLEEAFGGLVRRIGPSVRDRVRVVSPLKPQRAEKAQEYIERAIRASSSR